MFSITGRVAPVNDVSNLATVEAESGKNSGKVRSHKERKFSRSESVIDMNLLASFCPTLLLTNILKGDQIHLERKFLSGACLIADISGFVKLCGYLCKCGVEGFDDLQLCTSSFIGDLVKIVYSYGGDGM
jgi:hypothetical protein